MHDDETKTLQHHRLVLVEWRHHQSTCFPTKKLDSINKAHHLEKVCIQFKSEYNFFYVATVVSEVRQQ
jgi:hypothetical protein